MTDLNPAADAPGTVLFPEFESELYRMISTEVEGLTEEQLDFESDQWGLERVEHTPQLEPHGLR